MFSQWVQVQMANRTLAANTGGRIRSDELSHLEKYKICYDAESPYGFKANFGDTQCREYSGNFLCSCMQ